MCIRDRVPVVEVVVPEEPKIVTEPEITKIEAPEVEGPKVCLLYTSPSPRDRTRSRMPSSA